MGEMELYFYVIAALFGVVFAFLYGRVSNQTAIQAIKKRIAALFYEAFVFRHDVCLSLRAQGGMLLSALIYFSYAVKPILILLLPAIILLSLINQFFGYLPLSTQKPALVSLKLKDSSEIYNISLKSNQFFSVTPPLRVTKEKEIYWRIIPSGVTPAKKGELPLKPLQLSVTKDKKELARFPLVVEGVNRSHASQAINCCTILSNYSQPGLTWLLYPHFLQLPNLIESFSVDYPVKNYLFFGFMLSWIVVFFLVSLISGLVTCKIFKIEV
jgi:hypothetical protein